MAFPVKKININKSGRNTYCSAKKRFFVEVQFIYCLHGKPYYTIIWDWFIFPAYAFEMKETSNSSTGDLAFLNMCVQKNSLSISSWHISLLISTDYSKSNNNMPLLIYSPFMNVNIEGFPLLIIKCIC